MRSLLLLPLTLTAAACATAGTTPGAESPPAPVTTTTTAAAAGVDRETGAFVVRLGADTITVERYTRTGDRLEGDAAMRTPATALRHYVATLAPDGSITALDYETRRLNGSAPPTKARLRFTAGGASVDLSAGGRDTTMSYVAPSAFPYVNFSYALLEALVRRHLRTPGDSVAVPLVALGAPQPITGVLRRVGSDSVTFAVFEPTPSRARVDAAGRILGLQGLSTTQKVIVDRVADVDVQGTALAWARRDSAGQALGVLSPADSVKATVGGAQVAVMYSRPALRGRAGMGTLIPYDQVWRTGANAATRFTTSRDLVIGGAQVPAGSYTLWTLPTQSGAKLIINKQTGQWGTDYDAKQDLVRVDARVTRAPTPLERFTFTIEPNPAGTGGTIAYTWGETRFAVPFTVK